MTTKIFKDHALLLDVEMALRLGMNMIYTNQIPMNQLLDVTK